MTHEEIEKLKGRQLDAEVHRVLFPRHNINHSEDGTRWFVCEGEHEKHVDCEWQGLPLYSTDIAAAWIVFLNGLLAYGTADINADMENYGRGTFTRGGPEEVMHVSVGDWTTVDKVEAAICHSFLHAWLDGKEEKK